MIKKRSQKHIKEKGYCRFLLILSIIFLFTSAVLIIIYFLSNKSNFVTYNESANVKYDFNLMENEFYQTDYIEENMDVIADLIEKINIEFNYNLSSSEKLDYTYSYKVLSNMKLKDKSKTNLIYNNEETVLQKGPISEKKEKLELSENFSIVYQTYNQKIQKLIEQYKLDNTECDLSFTVYLEIKDNVTGKILNSNEEILSIKIPLDTKTVEIEVNNNVPKEEKKLIVNQNESNNLLICLIIGLVLLICGIKTLLKFIKYKKETKSPEEIYNHELKKILFDYKSYIQKINTKIDFDSYKLIEVQSFNELFRIREDIQLPILMYTLKNSNTTLFIIIKDTIIFAYVLGETRISKKLLQEGSEEV